MGAIFCPARKQELPRETAKAVRPEFLPPNDAQPHQAASANEVEALHRRAQAYRRSRAATVHEMGKFEMRVPREQEQELKLIFDCCDTDCNGVISIHELAAVCTKHPRVAQFLGLRRCASMGGAGRRPSADALFDSMDFNGDGAITWSEFCRFVLDKQQQQRREQQQQQQQNAVDHDSCQQSAGLPNAAVMLGRSDELKLIFDACDVDQNMLITINELMMVCIKFPSIARTVGLPPSPNGRSRSLGIEALFRQIDANADKRITFEEFGQFMTRLQGRCEHDIAQMEVSHTGGA